MSAHNGKTVRCFHDDRDDLDVDIDDTDADPTSLTFEEHGRYVQHLSGADDRGNDLRDRFQQSALRFDCPNCGRRHFMCPLCSEPDDSDDNSPVGWFRGDTTGEQIACHNCNQREVARQRRTPY